jgi:methylase of polypeptide subunit release factors
MQLDALLKKLGYASSPNFLRAGGGGLETAPALGHIFRRAIQKLGLEGIYALRPPDSTSSAPVIPVVYVCDAASDADADLIHRLVWNQDVVPFLLVRTPSILRLYSGFTHQRRSDGTNAGVLRTIRDFNDVAELVDTIHAERIDDGKVWQRWGKEIKPEERVDWRLLENLRQLDRWLQKVGGLDKAVSHALIGKYVYLHYLRDRKILSDEKLARWRIPKNEVFGRGASVKAVVQVFEELDCWLNGGIFPLTFHGRGAPTQEHLQRVAGTFAGDEPIGDRKWQLHLDFKAYDFSYIPIETLSVIYEQFLHAPEDTKRVVRGREASKTRGREAGAYYTPIPVVNFMLAEMEDRHPLERGMRVFDPSCGSGAFLVQCYRRLIEKEFPPTGEPPSPKELRDLLVRSIFGVDVDPDACGVTELSLVLTMLDYVDPPDLENHKRTKLPSLRGENIFCENFFLEDAGFQATIGQRKFDWIVGNPPWKKINPKKLGGNDVPVWQWMRGQEERGTPVGGNQVAQAFAWEIEPYLAAEGYAALLVPAMTLFEDPSKDFRAKFFASYQVCSVANFANLAEVLFAGRSRVPAAALFFSRRSEEQDRPIDAEEYIAVYSPLVANQEATRPIAEHTRGETWSLVLNASEVRDVPFSDVEGGSGLPWKLVTWGSHLDRRLLDKISRRFPRIEELEERGLLVLSEGLQLRQGEEEDEGAEEPAEKVEFVEEIVGKNRLDVTVLEGMRSLVTIPSAALVPVAQEQAYVRKGRVRLPLSVCKPPHVIVSAASSDFAYYHQFFTSTELGVKRPRATLAALREMPVPVASLDERELAEWVDLHTRLVNAEPDRMVDGELFRDKKKEQEFAKLFGELNARVFAALRMNGRERALVEDLVRVRLQLDDGKVGHEAIRVPAPKELKRYAKRLKLDLDAFIGAHVGKRHQVAVLHDDNSGVVQVDLVRNSATEREVEVIPAGSDASAEMERARRRLLRRVGQWVYFNRNLRIFEGTKTFIFKPMQRFHWTESQAMFDAAEIIAQTLEGSAEVS